MSAGWLILTLALVWFALVGAVIAGLWLLVSWREQSAVERLENQRKERLRAWAKHRGGGWRVQ